MVTHAASVAAMDAHPEARERSTLGAPELLLLCLFVLTWFEPEWLVAEKLGGGALLKRVPTLLTPFLLWFVFHRFRPEALYWPLVGFVAVHVAHLPMVENRGLLFERFQNLYHFFFLFMGAVCLLSAPRHVVTLVRIFLLSFVWYGLQGLPDGAVGWHTQLSNQDSYGPLMGMGIGFGFYFALGSSRPVWRWIGFLVAIIGVVGTIASIARGAVLSAGLVVALVWLRSPRKVLTLGAGAVGAIVLWLAVQVVHPPGAFWAEMETISEGKDAGTGEERWVMWGIGLEMFRKHPILGVGAGNTGAVAFHTMSWDEERSYYADPSQLYNKALHNIYVQLLSEDGIVGTAFWLAMLVGFYRRLRWIRAPDRQAAWREHTDGQLDLRMLSLGLECAMVAFLANGIFYNQIYIHWFWTLVTLAYLLALASTPELRATAAPDGSRETARSGAGR